MLSYRQALDLVLNNVQPLAAERLPVTTVHGRTLSARRCRLSRCSRADRSERQRQGCPLGVGQCTLPGVWTIPVNNEWCLHLSAYTI
jgi:hypothetical protein